MSDHESDNADIRELEEPESPGAQDYAGDPMLNLLVHLAEKGAEAAITLYSQGLVFTGTLCSRRSYWTAFSEQQQGTGFHPIADEILQLIDDEPADDDAPAPRYSFLHLRGGQVIAPGSYGMPSEGTPIRLDLSRVIGWSMGKLSASRS